MDNNYKKALEKIKKAQENAKCFNCSYQIINSSNTLTGPTGPQGDIGPTGPKVFLVRKA